MFARRRETNPHFLRPLQPQHDDDYFHPQSDEDHNLHPSIPVALPHDEHFLSGSPVVPTMQHPGQQPTRRETNPHFGRPLPVQHDGDHSHPPPVPLHDDHHPLHPHSTVAPPVHRHGPISPSVPHIEQDRPHMPSRPRGKATDQSGPKRPKTKQSAPKPIQVPVPQKGQSAPKPIQVPVPHKEPSAPKPTRTSPPPVLVAPDTEVGPQPEPHKHDPHPFVPLPKGRRPHPPGGQRLPRQKKTPPYTWFAAVFCVIFWLIIIVGGLIVLIVYLVFRPQSPHFDVSSVTLNAVYLDLGYLLNADVTVLANFTNPNKKVHVHFSSMIIDLYYGSTLIATQYVEPFSAAKATSRFAAIHMVSSQVRLPLKESQRLMKQMETNGVLFEVKGIFRATSKLGSILTYSYNLYGLCNIMVTRPPDGVLIKRKCRTKR